MTIRIPICPPDPLVGPDPTTITLRPMNAPFAADLFTILVEAHEWIVHDLRVAKRSQFVQPVPGDFFGIKFDPCSEGQTIELDVRYVGKGTGIFKAVLEGIVPRNGDKTIDPPDLLVSFEIPGHEAVIIGGDHGDGL